MSPIATTDIAIARTPTITATVATNATMVTTMATNTTVMISTVTIVMSIDMYVEPSRKHERFFQFHSSTGWQSYRDVRFLLCMYVHQHFSEVTILHCHVQVFLRRSLLE